MIVIVVWTYCVKTEEITRSGCSGKVKLVPTRSPPPGVMETPKLFGVVPVGACMSTQERTSDVTVMSEGFTVTLMVAPTWFPKVLFPSKLS